MTTPDAERRLAAFARSRGRDLVGLASHAALPVVLDPGFVHLLRVNYFLDPPERLAYWAEARLLLSPLCTEVDDGLYVMDPAVRDALLQHLVREYGSGRAPWIERAGLVEAQQLTALNLIDPRGAKDWLDRAQAASGPGASSDRRWFVAMREDLARRTAAVEEAAAEGTSVVDLSPALAHLADALRSVFPDPGAPARLAGAAAIYLPEAAAGSPPPRWRDVVAEATVSDVVPDLLEVAWSERPKDAALERAIQDYWIAVRPALRIEGGVLEEPPPEWRRLRDHWANVERAVEATCLVQLEAASGWRGSGLGFFVEGGSIVLMLDGRMNGDASGSAGRTLRALVGLATRNPVAPDRRAPQGPLGSGFFSAEVAQVDRQDERNRLVVVQLANAPDLPLPRPLRVTREEPVQLVGRNVFVLGYATALDARNDQVVTKRLLGGVSGVLRVHPGRTVKDGTHFRGAEHPEGQLAHDCFTMAGTGGSPLVDLDSGEVLGVHIGGAYDPGPRGLKRGYAAPVPTVQPVAESDVAANEPPGPLREPATEAPPAAAGEGEGEWPDPRLLPILADAARELHWATRTGYNQVLLTTSEGPTPRAPQLFVVADRVAPGKRTYREPGLEGVIGNALLSGAVVYAPDVREHARYIPAIVETRSELAVPVWNAGVVVGVLNSESARRDAYRGEAIRAVFEVAARLARRLEELGWRPPRAEQALPYVSERITVGAALRRFGDRLREDAWRVFGHAVALARSERATVGSQQLLSALHALPATRDTVERLLQPKGLIAAVARDIHMEWRWSPAMIAQLKGATDPCSGWLEPAVADAVERQPNGIGAHEVLALVVTFGRSAATRAIRNLARRSASGPEELVWGAAKAAREAAEDRASNAAPSERRGLPAWLEQQLANVSPLVEPQLTRRLERAHIGGEPGFDGIVVVTRPGHLRAIEFDPGTLRLGAEDGSVGARAWLEGAEVQTEARGVRADVELEVRLWIDLEIGGGEDPRLVAATLQDALSVRVHAAAKTPARRRSK